jgi:hypothetical protein
MFKKRFWLNILWTTCFKEKSVALGFVLLLRIVLCRYDEDDILNMLCHHDIPVGVLEAPLLLNRELHSSSL